jgi:hypothetical protein
MNDRLSVHAEAHLHRAAARLASAREDLGHALEGLRADPAAVVLDLSGVQLPEGHLPLHLTPASAERLYVLLLAVGQLRDRLVREVWEHRCPPRTTGPARDHCPLCAFDVVAEWLENIESPALFMLVRHLARPGALEPLVPQVLDGLNQLIPRPAAEADPVEDDDDDRATAEVATGR